VFIELTDHLRCTGDHDEMFLVLLPDQMAGRRVDRGTLGCPVCGRVTAVEGGVADFGGGRPSEASTSLTAPAIAALLGLSGPGGYLAVFGSPGAAVADLAQVFPGVRLVLVNPPEGIADSDQASVLRAGRSPLKARSMRGVVIGGEVGADLGWRDAAIAAALPGNRIVGEGEPPSRDDLEILATAGGVWVARAMPPAVRR